MPDVELIYDSDCPNVVNGRDVAGAEPQGSPACCRVYSNDDQGVLDAPAASVIANALPTCDSFANRNARDGAGRSQKTWLAMAPAMGLALLPNLTCPACWPAYAALLSSLGIGFLADSTSLMLLIITFLAVAVFALAWSAWKRRRYGPFLLALPAAALVISGKYLLNTPLVVYVGVGLFLTASVWSSWTRPLHHGARRIACGCVHPDQ